jgi:hypothetical protein
MPGRAEKASGFMGAGKLRVLAGRGGGVVAVGVAALAAACSHAASTSSPAAGQTPAPVTPATPTVSPSTVPVLGAMTYGTFPATKDGLSALTLCEQWAGLRGEYVSRVRSDTPYQLEQWFSSTVWRTAFSANSPLRVDPAYTGISTGFGLATTGEAASIHSARLLDQACAAAD